MSTLADRISLEVHKLFAAILGLAKVESVRVLQVGSRALLGVGLILSFVLLSVTWLSVWIALLISGAWGWSWGAAIVALIFISLAAVSLLGAASVARSKILEKNESRKEWAGPRTSSDFRQADLSLEVGPPMLMAPLPLGGVSPLNRTAEIRRGTTATNGAPYLGDLSLNEQESIYAARIRDAREGLVLAAEDFKSSAVKAINPLPPIEERIRSHPSVALLGGAALGVFIAWRRQHADSVSSRPHSKRST